MCKATGVNAHARLEEGERAIRSHVWRIHDRDYDLSSFVRDHPGGPMILLGKGSDCTMLFESYHAFNEPRKRLRKHDVSLDGLSPPVPPCPSPFLVDVHAMIREHFAKQPKFAHKAHGCQLLAIATLFVLEIAAAWYWLAFRSWIAGAVAGALNYLVMVNAAHDGSHGALSGRKWLNSLGHFAGGAPWVTGQFSWWLQHVVSHHQHTNELGLDVDVTQFPFARWHRLMQHEICGGVCAGIHNLVWHTVTFLGATLSMSIIHPIMFVWRPMCQMACSGKLSAAYTGEVTSAPMPRAKLRLGDNAHDAAFAKYAGIFASSGSGCYSYALVAGNLVCLILSIGLLVLPVALSPSQWPSGIGLGLVPYASASLCFMFITQISHIQEDCQSERTMNEPDPYKRQAMTSLDYGAHSSLVSFLTGSLNVQSVHHTLPSISLVHYTALYDKFHAICVTHDCAPQSASSLVHAIGAHIKYVYRLGRGDEFGKGKEMAAVAEPAKKLPLCENESASMSAAKP